MSTLPDSEPLVGTNTIAPVAVATDTTTSNSGSNVTAELHPLPSPFIYTTPPPTLITQGAEALVYKTCFLTPSKPAALKFRPSKAYRHPTLDARLTKSRVLAEARVLVKLSGSAVEEVKVPGIWGLEWDVGRGLQGRAKDGDGEVTVAAAKGAWILMEWIEGRSVKELLRGVDTWAKGAEGTCMEQERERVDGEVKALLRRIGRAVGAMHAKGGVVHGDLTSSNVMVRPVGGTSGMQMDVEASTAHSPPDLSGEIVLIDFGLATQSVQDEDRAVDIYVLERAFGSTHPRQEGWFDAEVLQHPDGYKGSFKGANVVLKRLEEVRMRGRKRSMIG